MVFDEELLSVATVEDILSSAAGSNGMSAIPRNSYRTPSITLRALSDADLPLLYAAATSPAQSHLWRFRGRTPSREEFVSILKDNVLCQYVVADAESLNGIALVTAYAADLVSGHAYVGVQRFDRSRKYPSGLAFEGCLAFIQYIFDSYNFFKVYFEIPAYNSWIVSGLAEEVLELEGRLLSHYFHDGTRHDLYYYALYQQRWQELAELYRGPPPQ